jgi:hypothetical protein
MEFAYKNKPLILSRTAMNEMMQYGYDLYDILEILNSGYDCSKSKRSKNIIERCIDRKEKTVRAVVAESYNYAMDCEVWVVTHFGITSKPG